MVDAGFDLERLRLQAAHSLPAGCFDDFQRLSRSLLHGPDFQWLLVDAPHEGLRAQVMLALDGVLKAAGMATNRLPLSDKIADVAALERRLVNNAAKAAVVHVIGRQGWFNASRWDAFNVRRERIAAGAKARLVFWLDAEAIALVSQGAPDLWAWRAGIYAFLPESVAASQAEFKLVVPTPSAGDTRTMAERFRRVAEIRAWLAAHPDAPDDLLFGPVDELGRLLFDIGERAAALAHWREVELPMHRRRNDEFSIAITLGQVARALQAKGEFGAALVLLRTEVAPIFERLGSVRERAITTVMIADILRIQGHLDEARQLLVAEALPLLRHLSDAPEMANTLDRIADILQQEGQLDEALKIRREQILPVFEQNGDLRSKAVTMGKIADILQLRGQLDEALRIRREEQLPVYQRLGDLRGVAVVSGRIADVLDARNRTAEALRIRRSQVLPIFEKLGATRETAVTKWQIGEQLLKSSHTEGDGRLMLKEAFALLEPMALPETRKLAARLTELD